MQSEIEWYCDYCGEDTKQIQSYDEGRLMTECSQCNKVVRPENVRQGDMNSMTSFVALTCANEDIMDAMDITKEQAQELIESDSFRSKFTETIMNDFWETLYALKDEYVEEDEE